MHIAKFRWKNNLLRLHIRDEADSSVAFEIFKHREYRAAEEIVRKAEHPIVDVGAHAGFFTIYCRGLNAAVPIYALEPDAENFSLLQQHLKENNILNCRPLPLALAGVVEKRTLLKSTDSHNHRLLRMGEEKKYDKAITIKVSAVSLAELCTAEKIKKIGLLKMDIEGGEYEIFDALTAADYARINAVIMEYHAVTSHTVEQLQEQLRQHGFGVQRFPSHFDKTMGFLWAMNKKSFRPHQPAA